MIIKGVIFDFDGTLADTLPDISANANHTLAAFGLPPKKREDYLKYISNSTGSLRSLLIDDGFSMEYISEILEVYLERHFAHLYDLSCPFTGIPELISALAQKRIPVAINSNKQQAHLERITSVLFKDAHFDYIFGVRAGIPAKPDPAGALEIAGLWGFEPNEIIYLGDSEYDMQTAVNAGMIAVAATWGYQTVNVLKENGADYLISAPSELLSLI